jgi:acyl-CoA reductase-like NAD-dependent aldehyde dehydrogenase/ubiquinone/menaquinone biosynthesis C-methylase UbiE
MNRKSIKHTCNGLIETILSKRNEFISALITVESYKTALIELQKSENCLRNIHKQIDYLVGEAKGNLCVYMPMNQPLYSLILFAVIPGFMFEKVYFRPPSIMPEVYQKLNKLLMIDSLVSVIDSRQNFLTNYIRNADAVIYTGKYENSMDVLSSLGKDKLFFLQGSGTNPVVLTESANINDETVKKIVVSQTYNSGQDCMSPAAIFVAETVFLRFVDMLIKMVKGLKIGSYDDKNADISPLLETDSVKAVLDILNSGYAEILLEGKVDIYKRLVSPYILKFKNIEDIPSLSLFAPIFCLYSFSGKEEVEQYLNRTDCQDNKAYISIFGDSNLNLSGEVLIKNDILDSVDDGSSEFGGFGKHSGFVAYNGTLSHKPILISKEIYLSRIDSGDFTNVGDLNYPFYESAKVLTQVNTADKVILEIGCGIGPHAQYLAKQCKDYIAVDIDKAKIKDATAMITYDNLNFIVNDATKLSFADKSFDIVLMFHCLHEVIIENQSIIMEEIYRVLKGNGHLIIIDAVSEPVSDFQKCFDVVHEGLFNITHIIGTIQAETVITDYIKNAKFIEIKKELLKEEFTFSNIEELLSCLKNSFEYEIEWNKRNIQHLNDLISAKYSNAFAKGPVCMSEYVILRHLVTGRQDSD